MHSPEVPEQVLAEFQITSTVWGDAKCLGEQQNSERFLTLLFASFFLRFLCEGACCALGVLLGAGDEQDR